MPVTDAPFLLNAWYAAALTRELDGQALFHRRILGISVLLYRLHDGTPVALHDRCPHRFAPLHMGKRLGDEVSCVYHALRFDASGRCTHNPHGHGQIPKAARIRTFPVLERYGLLWIWMGDAPAEPASLPDFSPLETGHANGVGYTYMHLKAHFELVIDNVMDLSHVDHVHGEAISTRGQLSPQIPRVQETPRAITTRWEWTQTPPMLSLANFLPAPTAAARHFVQVTWSPPANIQLSVGATQGDGVLDLDSCVGQYDLHMATPETLNSTHYFFATRRNHCSDDADYNQAKIAAMHAAFMNEDGPIIQAVHEEMGTTDFLSLNPVLLTSDSAPVRVRRALQQLVADEHAARQSQKQ